MKVRYVSSPNQDDMLGPEEYRRYTNHIFCYFLFFFILLMALAIPIFFDGYLFSGSNPFLKNLLIMISKSSKESLSFPPSIMIPKLFLSVTPPAFLSWIITNQLTKPVCRQIHLGGNFLDQSPNIFENLRKDFYRVNAKPDLALIREGEIDYNFKITGKRITATIYLPPEALELSTVIRGEAGSGKTVIGDRLIKEVIDNDHKVILHSIKGDEIKKLAGYADFYLIEPWNKDRGYAIDYLNMVVSLDKEKELASIRTLVDSFNTVQKGKESFFDKGATAVVEAIVRCVVSETKKDGLVKGDLGNVVSIWNSFDVQEVDTQIDNTDPSAVQKELGKNLTQLEKIKAFLQQWNKSATIYVDPENAKTSLCVLASCIEVIRKFEVLSNFWKDRKSLGKTLDIRKWLNTEPKKDRKVIVLVNSNKFADVANCYISAFINLTVSEVIEESYSVDWKLYFILDEFPQLQAIKVDEFLKLPDVGRGKGIRTIVMLQRTSQIKSSFNMDGESFIGAFQNKIWARMATDDLATLEKEIGKKDVRDYTVSSNNNAQGKSTSNRNNRITVNVLNPNEIQNQLGPVTHNGKFCGVRALFKFTNNPRASIIIMPPVKFGTKQRKQVGKTDASAPIKNLTSNENSESEREEIVITTETVQELETTINGETEYELEPDESDPIGSALSHFVGGEVVSMALEVSEVAEGLENFSKNTNSTEVVDTTVNKTEKVSSKKALELIKKAKEDLKIDEGMDL